MRIKTAQSARHFGLGTRAAKGPCSRAYADAQAEAMRRPPSAPLQRLHQLHGHLDDMQTTLFAIFELVQGKRSYPPGLLPGLCCTTEDKGIWLKNIPKVLASFLGQIVLPPSVPRTAFATFREQTASLIAAGEVVQAVAKPSVEIEYCVMRNGESHMLPLILKTRALLYLAMANMPRN